MTVVTRYADFAFASYSGVVKAAERLQREIQALLAAPSACTLASARASWIDARDLYGATEVLRFYDGPIDHAVDGVETLLNAWPVDEAYIDAVEGDPRAGFINQSTRYPHLSAALLELVNERGGEANVSLGWHAIEFLLWGQDRSATGPGDRSHEDYMDGLSPNAGRRREYLRIATELLVGHLRKPSAAWHPESGAYRRKFIADPAALRKILTGAAVLSGFEMAGERLAVAYETRDQEQEHSCFSDTTSRDFAAGQAGVREVLLGIALDGRRFPAVVDLVKEVRPEIAAELVRRIDAATEAIRSLPNPFDQALLAADDSPQRTSLRRAMEALEAQTEIIAIVGSVFGYQLPLKPGG